MDRVLRESRRVGRSFEAASVHDLRVALRRCRSLASVLRRLDPYPGWKRMRSSGTRLFQSLGELRDVQVLMEWVGRLAPADDGAAERALVLLGEKEKAAQQAASAALARFERKEWQRLARVLEPRAARVPLEYLALRHFALERWIEAREMQRRALRDRSQLAWHRLRISLKRFRYTVENFLPHRHEAWGKDLKQLQDLLGDVHDLDVLWQTMLGEKVFSDAESENHWRDLIQRERGDRIAAYRAQMMGRDSLWTVWRRGLPQGLRLEAAALKTLATWASFRDPDFDETRRTARLSRQLFEGLAPFALRGSADPARLRRLLSAASRLFHVGSAKGKKGRRKTSYRLVRELTPPIGWSREDLQVVAVVARYHRGRQPDPARKPLQRLSAEDRELALFLTGILRMTLVLAANESVRKLRVESTLEGLIISADPWKAEPRVNARLAAERYLLERCCQRPVLVRAMRSGPAVIPFPGRTAVLGESS